MINAPIAGTANKIFVHSHALVESDDVGPDTRIWAFAHVMQGARIGSGCNICGHVFVEMGAVVGDRVTVKNGVFIWDRVTIEDDVFLGPNCVLTNDFNPRVQRRKTRAELFETRIRNHATIGANATIVCGVKVGRGAFVGAGAVVTRSIPNFALVVGSPAWQTGWMCLCAEKLALPVAAAPGSTAVCEQCGRVFTMQNTGLRMLCDPVRSNSEAT